MERFEPTSETIANTELAQVIRAANRHRGELLKLDPWIPFPQNGCCFRFGDEKTPLPIGALFRLWDHWRTNQRRPLGPVRRHLRLAVVGLQPHVSSSSIEWQHGADGITAP